MKLNNKGITIIEMLLFILLVVLLTVICLPISEKILLSRQEEKIQKETKVAMDLYVRGRILINDKNCYNVPYNALLVQGYLKQKDDENCSGFIQVKTVNNNSYEYKYYLNCTNATTPIMNNTKKLPKGCINKNG